MAGAISGLYPARAPFSAFVSVMLFDHALLRLGVSLYIYICFIQVIHVHVSVQVHVTTLLLSLLSDPPLQSSIITTKLSELLVGVPCDASTAFYFLPTFNIPAFSASAARGCSDVSLCKYCVCIIRELVYSILTYCVSTRNSNRSSQCSHQSGRSLGSC